MMGSLRTMVSQVGRDGYVMQEKGKMSAYMPVRRQYLKGP